jgi:hypothetical protein
MTRWYRAYDGTVTDPKFGEIALVVECSCSVALSAWQAIPESCARLNEGGRFDATPRRVAVILGEPVKTIEAVFAEMRSMRMIDGDIVAAWAKRQFESDSSTEPSRKHREAMRNANATLHERPVTVAATEAQRVATRSDTDTDTEKKEGSLRSLATSVRDGDLDEAYRKLALAERPRKPAKARPRSSIADDAQPAAMDAQAASDAGLSADDFRVQWRKFRDYHRAKGSLMADWSAAWRTWLGNINEFKRGGNTNGKRTVHDAAREIHAGVVAGVITFPPRPPPVDVDAYFRERDLADGMLSEGRS